MKRWITAWAALCLMVIAAPLRSEDKAEEPVDVDRPPEIFYTPDTLMMMRVDLASITGPMLQQMVRGMFNAEGWKLTNEDKFSEGMLKLAEVVAGEYEKQIRHPFEAKGGSSIWVVTMSAGGTADSRVYLLVRLGRGLGMKPQENFEEWINTKGGGDHMVGLTEWVKSLDPAKQLMGTTRKEGEKNPADFTQVTRVGEYLVCSAPGTPLPTAEQFDPTTLLAFTQAMHIGSRQRVAWAIFPHQRWRDDVAANLKKAQEEVDKKKAKGKAAGMGDVMTAQMMMEVLNRSQWIAGWLKLDDSPGTAVVVRAKSDDAAAQIQNMYDQAITATYALAAYYDAKETMRNFLNPERNKQAEESYVEFARSMAKAMSISRKGPLVGLVLETSEIQSITLVYTQWSKKQETLEKEQQEEEQRKRDERRK